MLTSVLVYERVEPTISSRRRPGSILKCSRGLGRLNHLKMDSGLRRNDIAVPGVSGVNTSPLGEKVLEGRMMAPFFTSPFGGEVDPLGSGEGALLSSSKQRPPHPALRADLSSKGRGKKGHNQQ
jgi:hypothetical protein